MLCFVLTFITVIISISISQTISQSAIPSITASITSRPSTIGDKNKGRFTDVNSFRNNSPVYQKEVKNVNDRRHFKFKDLQRVSIKVKIIIDKHSMKQKMFQKIYAWVSENKINNMEHQSAVISFKCKKQYKIKKIKKIAVKILIDFAYKLYKLKRDLNETITLEKKNSYNEERIEFLEDYQYDIKSIITEIIYIRRVWKFLNISNKTDAPTPDFKPLIHLMYCEREILTELHILLRNYGKTLNELSDCFEKNKYTALL